MKHPERYFFWGIIALAAILRFVTLGNRPFDGDEGVILLIAEQPLGALLGAIAVDVHPPLYHLLVHSSISLFGVSEWSVRLVGVLAGIVLVALYPILGSTLGSTLRVPGWILGLLLAMSPYLVNLSQDARMYSLLVFLATAFWIVTYRLGMDRVDRWSWWLGWTALALGIVYTHHIGWLIVGLFLSVLVWQLLSHRAKGGFRISYLVSRISTAIGLLILGYLPQLGTTIAQVQGRLGEQSLGSGLGDTISGVGGGLYRMLAGRTFLDLNPGGLAELASANPLALMAFVFTLVVPVLLLLIGFRHLRGNTPGVLADESTSNWRPQALAIIGVSFLLALLVGTIGTQASRYLSYLAPFIFSFLAIGCVAVWKSAWGKAAVFVVALTFLAGLTTQYVRHNQSAGVDAYAHAIEAELEPGDAVLLRGGFAGGEARAFNFYRERCGDMPLCLKSDRGPFPFAVPIVDLFADYDVRKSNLDELRSLDPVTKVVELLAQPDIKRVWYFDNTYQQPTLIELPEGLVAEVIPLFAKDKEGKQLLLTKVTKQ